MVEPFRIEVADSDLEDLRLRLGRTRLAMVSLYWFTGTIGTSFLPYYHGSQERTLPLIEVPVGVAVQWGERGFPREYAEPTYNDIMMWTDLPRGGHFTAKQTPDLVATAMREFFGPLRD